MKRAVLLLSLAASMLCADIVENKVWEPGKTLLSFLEDNNVSLSLYYNLHGEDKELAEEIVSGDEYYVSYDDSGKRLKQALIPIGTDSQIHIYEKDKNKYKLKIEPISYFTKKDYIVVEVDNSLFQDVYELTDDRALASEVVSAFKKSLNFKKYLRKGDKAVAIYENKIRLGKRLGNPKIEAAMVELNKHPNYIFLYQDGKYYDNKGREIEGFHLNVPLRYTRISSPFTKARYHPILKRYRPHLGIDYAAPRGTPVHTAANGKIVFRGRKGGYGNVMIVQHDYGYRTLYAHLKGFKSGLSVGSYVKKGQTIAYVGTSGLSTGPHLHFGLYRNKEAINPNIAIKVIKHLLDGKEKNKFLALKSGYMDLFQTYLLAYEKGRYKYNPTYLA